MEKNTIANFAELANLVDQHKRGNWLYRGVTRFDHELIPKIGRKNGPYVYCEDTEKQVFEEFKRQALPLVEKENPTNLEWLAIAQQHGLRTRLLDWTESIFVAAFFATESGVTYKGQKHEEKVPFHPAIYGIRDLPMISGHEDPFNLDEETAYRPSHITPRIAPQLAAFTIHPKPDQVYEAPKLVRWILDIPETLELKLALDASGFTRASLFPGIDGLAQALNWQLKWDRLRG